MNHKEVNASQPLLSKVGTSGSACARWRVDTARALTLPD